ncbi:uncharacterized protein LOC129914955 [Episyrphus balteatus]|uniref:uncharacterized protein LOC129914955 n=1 Tax=Episyrphus balteatus TaxID=286459 RepID=UPI002484E34D|nr:uncharacterized protein LOC129914955 [Episyrphus balteatus]
MWNHILNVAKSVTFSNEWNDWIIIPARSETNRFKGIDSSKNFSEFFDVNSNEKVQNFIGNLETFLMRTVKFKDNNWQQQRPVRVKSENSPLEDNSDLVIPLGRAMEKVKTICSTVMEFFDENLSNDDYNQKQLTGSSRNIKKLKKKYKKLLFPLLVAYKLKFLALIPLLMGGLVLLVGTTGMAGFFFALFTAVMSLRSEHKVEVKKW